MHQGEMPYIKSGGRRLRLYAELGRYFAPDGRFDETVFRAYLRTALSERLAASGEDRQAETRHAAGQWLSAHIEEVLAYLEERGLQGAMPALFQAAAEESAALDIGAVSVSPARLSQLLSLKQKAVAEPVKTRRSDPDEKRRAILDAALSVFSARGFHEATMEEIAQVSGVAKGTLYLYFAGKDDLLEQLLLSTSRQLAIRFADAFGSEGALLEQLQAFIESWVAFIEENHALYRLLQTEGLNGAAGRQTMIYEYLLADFPMAKERFAALDATQVLKTANFHTVAYGVLGFIDGVAQKWFRSNREYPLRAELPIILEMLFNGIVRDPSRTRSFYVPPEETASSASTDME